MNNYLPLFSAKGIEQETKRNSLQLLGQSIFREEWWNWIWSDDE